MTPAQQEWLMTTPLPLRAISFHPEDPASSIILRQVCPSGMRTATCCALTDSVECACVQRSGACSPICLASMPLIEDISGVGEPDIDLRSRAITCTGFLYISGV